MTTSVRSGPLWISTVVLIIMVWGLPLMLGGVTTIGLSILFLGAPIAVFFALAAYATGEVNKGDRSGSFLAMWCVGSVCILIDPLFDMWQMRTPDALADVPAEYLVNSSIYRSATYWGHFSAYIGIAWIMHFLPKRHALFVLFALLAMGLFQTVYGLSALATDAAYIFDVWQRSNAVTSTGSFYNSNHFAGFLELALPLLLGIGLFYLRDAKASHRPLLIGLMIVGAIIMFLGVAASRSRLGLVGMVAGLICFWVLNSMRHETNSGNRLLITAGIVLTLAATLWFGMSSVVEEWFILFERGNARFDVWMATLDYPSSWWMVGIGPGRFADYYPLVQPFGFDVRYDYLHNDMLQFVLELGLVRALIMIGAFVVLLVPHMHLGRNSIKTGAFAGMVAILVHSFGDFNLQIRGVAIVFWMMLGVVLSSEIVVSEQSPRRHSRRSPGGNQPPPNRQRVRRRVRKRSSSKDDSHTQPAAA